MADHIAVACLIDGREAYNDNGEFGSGFRLLRAIKTSGLDNVALFMIRQYGGVNLGPKRFTIMTELAELALEKLEEARQRIPETSSKSTPSTPSSSRHSSGSSSPDNDARSTLDNSTTNPPPDEETPQEENPTNETEGN